VLVNVEGAREVGNSVFIAADGHVLCNIDNSLDPREKRFPFGNDPISLGNPEMEPSPNKSIRGVISSLQGRSGDFSSKTEGGCVLGPLGGPRHHGNFLIIDREKTTRGNSRICPGRGSLILRLSARMLCGSKFGGTHCPDHNQFHSMSKLARQRASASTASINRDGSST
jgi:hypothetical protein